MKTPIVATATPANSTTSETEDTKPSYPWVDSDAKFFHYMHLKVLRVSNSGKEKTNPNGSTLYEDIAVTICYRRARLSDTQDEVTVGWAFCSPSDRKTYKRAQGRRIAWDRMLAEPSVFTIPADASPPTAIVEYLRRGVRLQSYLNIERKAGYTISSQPVIPNLPTQWRHLNTHDQMNAKTLKTSVRTPQKEKANDD